MSDQACGGDADWAEHTQPRLSGRERRDAARQLDALPLLGRFVSSMPSRPGELGCLLKIQANADPGPIGELNPAALKLSQYLAQSSLVGKGLVCLESI